MNPSMGFVRRRFTKSQVAMLAGLISLGVLNGFPPPVKIIGFGVILASLGLASVFLVALLTGNPGGKLPRGLGGVLFVGGLFVLINVLGLFIGGVTERAIIVVGQVLAVFSFFIVIASVNWLPEHVRIVSSIMSPAILLLSLFGSRLPTNPNTVGAFLSLLMFWPLAAILVTSSRLTRVGYSFIAVTALLGVINSGARSTWLAIAMTGFTFFAYPMLRKRKWRYMLWFVLVFVAISCFVVIYPRLNEIPFSTELQRIVRETTGSNLFSGRDRLWPPILEYIKKSPWVGYGPGVDTFPLLQTDLGPHNLYLQIGLEVGFLGLGLFVFLLWQIWMLLWRGRHNQLVRLSASAQMGIMLHQVFEIGLTQYNLAAALLQWLSLGVGVSVAMSLTQKINQPRSVRSEIPSASPSSKFISYAGSCQ